MSDGNGDTEKIVLDRKSFETLSSATRTKMLRSLAGRRKTLTELADELKMSVSTIKEHLENLESTGFVQKIDDGHKWKYYDLTSKGKELGSGSQKEVRIWVVLSFVLAVLLISTFVFLGEPVGVPVLENKLTARADSSANSPTVPTVISPAPSSAVSIVKSEAQTTSTVEFPVSDKPVSDRPVSGLDTKEPQNNAQKDDWKGYRNDNLNLNSNLTNMSKNNAMNISANDSRNK